jgi:hypothetical protein
MQGLLAAAKSSHSWPTLSGQPPVVMAAFGFTLLSFTIIVRLLISVSTQACDFLIAVQFLPLAVTVKSTF